MTIQIRSHAEYLIQTIIF